jgi:hypothetical protein
MTGDSTIDIEEVARALERLFIRLAAAGEDEPDRATIWEKLQEQFPGIAMAQIDEAGAVMARNTKEWFASRGIW